jgi:hypothetical protein
VATYTRLQTALDITAAKNSRLASTYREIYAEQAKAARAEVAARDRQFAANSGYAPGLVRQGKSASQSGSVFEAAFARDAALARDLATGLQAVANASKLIDASATRELATGLSAVAVAAKSAAEAEMRLIAEANEAWASIERTAVAARSVDIALIDAGKAAQSAFSIGNSAIEQFEANLRSVAELTERALSSPRNANGSFNLNVGGAREAAAAAQAQAIAAREVAAALERVARAEGDTTQATQQAVNAARAHAVAAEAEASAIGGEVAVLEKLQTELNLTASKTTAVVAGQRGLRNAFNDNTISSRQNRFAYVQTGQQLQDMVIQAQAGTSAFTILVQQGSQLAFGLSNLGGKAGTVARFFAGPFGTAAFIAVAALGSFYRTAKQTEDELGKLVQSADAFGNAQSDLGKVMDLVTGKFSDHNMVLRETIRLQAMQSIQGAQTAQEDARKALLRATGTTAFNIGTPGSTGGLTANSERGGANITPELYNLANRFASGGLGSKEDPSGIVAARKELERLIATGKVAGRTLIDLEKAFLDLAVPKNTIQAQQAIIDALDGKGLDPRLRRDAKKPRDRTNQIGNLNEFGNDALDRANAVAGRFEGQPRAVEQARRAYAELDNIQRDLIRKNEELIKVSGKPIANFAEVTAGDRRGAQDRGGRRDPPARRALREHAQEVRPGDGIASGAERHGGQGRQQPCRDRRGAGDHPRRPRQAAHRLCRSAGSAGADPGRPERRP